MRNNKGCGSPMFNAASFTWFIYSPIVLIFCIYSGIVGNYPYAVRALGALVFLIPLGFVFNEIGKIQSKKFFKELMK